MRQCCRTICVPGLLIAGETALDEVVESRAAVSGWVRRTCESAGAPGHHSKWMHPARRPVVHPPARLQSEYNGPVRCLDSTPRHEASWCATACRCRPSAATAGTPAYVYGGGGDRRALPRARRGRFRPCRTRCTTPSRPTRPSPSCAGCAAARQRGRRQLRSARSRWPCAPDSRPATGRVHRRRQDARRTGARGRPRRRRPSTPSRPARSSALTRIARRPGRAPASRSASIRTSTPRSHPHISTGLRATKFGVSDRGGARASAATWRGRAGLARRRPPRPHRIADHHARAAGARAPRALAGSSREPARRGHRRSSTSISAAGSASPTTDAGPETVARLRLDAGG